MNKKQVSIIIPTYNSQNCLKTCLDSLLQQTYTNLEILVIDDGSVDNTREICDDYEKKDPRIRAFHVKNAGVSAARNRGIAEASSEYIMFVDSDDYVEKNHVELHYHALEEQNADLVISGYFIRKGKNIETNKISKELHGVLEKKEFCSNFLKLYEKFFINSPWNKIYKKQLFTTGFPVDMALGEDLQFNMSYFQKVERVVILPECSYYYVCDETNQSLTGRITKENFSSYTKNFHTVMDFCKNQKIEDSMIVKEMYVSGIIAMIFSMGKKKFSHQEKREVLSAICTDELTKKAMKEVKTRRWESEQIRNLLVGRKVLLLTFILDFYEFFIR